MKDTTTIRAPRSWPGLLALVLAVASVATFIAVMSVLGPFPKSIAFGHNLLFEAAVQSPTISWGTGCLGVVVAAIRPRNPWSVPRRPVGSPLAGLLLFTPVIGAGDRGSGRSFSAPLR